MKIGYLCNKNPVVAYEDTTLYEAARLMRGRHVGSVIVVSKEEEGPRPIGIVTDRDIVVEIIAEEIDINSVTLGDVMSMYPIITREDDELYETLESMFTRGVRRMPVVDSRGYLIGIFTTDDLLNILSNKLNNLALLIQQEKSTEIRTRPGR